MLRQEPLRQRSSGFPERDANTGASSPAVPLRPASWPHTPNGRTTAGVYNLSCSKGPNRHFCLPSGDWTVKSCPGAEKSESRRP
jgi:hypothetical protein